MVKICSSKTKDILRRNLVSLLKREDHDVYISQSQLECLITAAKTKSDIILYGINNPKMNGYDIFDELQRQHHTRGFLLSSLSKKITTLVVAQIFILFPTVYCPSLFLLLK